MTTTHDSVNDAHFQYYIGNWCVFDKERAGDFNLVAIFLCFLAMGLYLGLVYWSYAKQRKLREAGGVAVLMSDSYNCVETYSLFGMYQLRILRVVAVAYLVKLGYTLIKLAMGSSFGDSYYTDLQMTGKGKDSYSFMQLIDILINLVIYQFYQVALLL